MVRRGKTNSKVNHTVIYWQVAGDNLAEVHKAILKQYPRQYREVDEPMPDPVPDGPKHRKPTPERSLIEDDSGNQIGLLVNPPYPRGRKKNHPQKPPKYLLPLVGLAVGLFAGPALARITKFFISYITRA